MKSIDHLKPGDRVKIAFGAKGSQLAVVYDRTAHGNVRVHKWSGIQKRWKGPLKVWPQDVIDFATPADFHTKRITSEPPKKPA